MPAERRPRRFIPAPGAPAEIYFENPEGRGIVASDALRSDDALALLNKGEPAYPSSIGMKVTFAVEGPGETWRFTRQKYAKHKPRDRVEQVPHSKQKALEQVAEVLYEALEKHVGGDVHEQMKSIVILGIKQIHTSSYQCVLRWPDTTLPTQPPASPLRTDVGNGPSPADSWLSCPNQQVSTHTTPSLPRKLAACPSAGENMASYEDIFAPRTTSSWITEGHSLTLSVDRHGIPADPERQGINTSIAAPVPFFPLPCKSRAIGTSSIPADIPINTPVDTDANGYDQGYNIGGILDEARCPGGREYGGAWLRRLQIPFDSNVTPMQDASALSPSVYAGAQAQDPQSESSGSVASGAGEVLDGLLGGMTDWSYLLSIVSSDGDHFDVPS